MSQVSQCGSNSGCSSTAVGVTARTVPMPTLARSYETALDVLSALPLVSYVIHGAPVQHCDSLDFWSSVNLTLIDGAEWHMNIGSAVIWALDIAI